MNNISFLGVVNATPNSFSDGHLNQDLDFQKSQIKKFQEANYLIDIGAESTAPFNDAISYEEEWPRLKSYLDTHINSLSSFGTISIDTYKPHTISSFMDSYGSHFKSVIWNDVSGIVDDETIVILNKYKSLDYVLCHTLVPSRDEVCNHMNYINDAFSLDILKSFFIQKLEFLKAHGIDESRIILDPCFGFSKSLEQNLELLDSISEILNIHPYWLIGISKKSFLQHLVKQECGNLDRKELMAKSEVIHWDYLGHYVREFLKLKSAKLLLLRVHDVGNITV